MKTISTATTPAAYTNSFASTLTIAAILGIAAGATTAKAWNEQDAERMTRDKQGADNAQCRGAQNWHSAGRPDGVSGEGYIHIML